jgi:large-conductance mechanosensitive channel
MSSDQKTNNVIGWTVAGVCVLAAQFVGWGEVVVMLALFAVLLGVVGYLNYQMFNAAHDKAAQRHQKENEAAKTELAKTLKEISRLRAHGERHQPPQSVVWGRN